MVAPIVIIVLILANAFFVGAEFGLVSARRSAIELSALNGSRWAKITLEAMERVSVMLAAAQLGVTLCSLGLGAVGEPFIAHMLDSPFHSLGIPAGALHPISLVLALGIMTYLHVVFGEMIPKNVALAGPDRTAVILTPILIVLVRVLRPVVAFLNALANGSTRLLGVRPKNEVASTFTRDEVAEFVEESQREGLLSEDEEQLLKGSLRFDDKTVRSLLLPSDALVIVDTKVTPADIERLVGKTGYSRFPVRNSRRKLIGYIHLKDILGAGKAAYHQPIPSADIRPLPTVEVHNSLRQALTTMQRAGAHLAQVVEKGDYIVGVVALEDVLEELVGEISDSTQRAARE